MLLFDGGLMYSHDVKLRWDSDVALNTKCYMSYSLYFNYNSSLIFSFHFSFNMVPKLRMQ